MIGFMGAHRTGKTSLAMGVAREFDYNFLKTDVSGHLAKLGVDPKRDMGFLGRLKAQNSVLDYLEEIYSKQTAAFVTDRTPLDVLAYTMSEIQREVLTDPEVSGAFEHHMVRAHQLAVDNLGVIVLVQPGIPMVETAGKAPSNTFYVEHIHACMANCLEHHQRITQGCGTMPRDCLDLSERISHSVVYARAIIANYSNVNPERRVH